MVAGQDMTFTFLGTGTSGGVPSLGCSCRVCRSEDGRDHRLRSAGVLDIGSTSLLIDCGPDSRQQLLRYFRNREFRKFDGVLLTHSHYDHVAGIDDLRPMCVYGDIDIYADALTVGTLHQTMPYCFTTKLYPGVPRLNLVTVEPHRAFTVGGVEVLPIRAFHDKLPILGFRIDGFAYLTDVKTLPDEDVALLQGVDTLVINALRFEIAHHSHLLVADALAYAKRIGARRTWLTHATHQIGLHDEANARVMLMARDCGYAGEVAYAFDGLSLEV